MNKKILGILGGMGPYAALLFAKNLLDLTPVKKDWDHIHTIIDNNISIPSRTRAILYNEKSPVPGIIKSINKLADYGVDFVVLPCNSAHYFYPEVKDKINVKWFNMLKTVSDVIKEAKCKKTLVLGGYVTVFKKTYDNYMNTVYLNESDNEIVYNLIEAVKINNMKLSDSLARQLFDKIIKLSNSNSIDSVLLGCTEFALVKSLYKLEKENIKLFDSNVIYAKSTVEECLGFTIK